MLLSTAFGLIAIIAGVSGRATSFPRDSPSRVAYFQDNDPAGSSIVALHISNTNGTLSSSVKTPTGGKGLAGLIAISQDAVTVSGNLLFTVNPGDDTLSMFNIDGNDPQNPKLVGQPASTLGDTPVTVAYSDPLKTACVLNSGANAGVTCFDVDPQKGLSPQGGIRPVAQFPFQGPAPETIGADIAFNPSSTALFATTGGVQAGSGKIYAYSIQDRKISTDAVVSSFSDLVFLFSLNFLDNSDSHLIVTNPHLNGFGAALVNVEYPSLKATLTKGITFPAEVATCWVAYAPQFDSAYVIDAANPLISIINPETGDIKTQVTYNVTMPGSGGYDSKVDRNYLYTLTDDQQDPRINVFDISRGGYPVQVQSFNIFQQVGTIPDWMGMSIWPQY